VPIEKSDFKILLNFLKKNKQILWFLGFVFSGVFYFGSKFFESTPNIIHIGLDDKIPFLPIFIIPYIIWYIYVPVLMLCVCFNDKKSFNKQAFILFSGMFLSCVFFLIYPTGVDFRPTAEGKGILLWLCRIIYKNDTPPVNVLPSLHCFEAITVHLTTFVWGPLKKCLPLRITSAVLMLLICASTVFVKQHSIVDVVCGCLLGFVICLITEHICKLRG